MDLSFHKISDFSKDTLHRLLCGAYAYDKRYRELHDTDWREAGRFFHDNPAIADSCGFITVLKGEAVGFACWDPRNLPSFAEIGHNCILQDFKGRGFGKAQLREALRRILKRNPEKVIVTTNKDLIPAQRMYEGLGFTVVRTWESKHFSHIDYEMCLSGCGQK